MLRGAQEVGQETETRLHSCIGRLRAACLQVVSLRFNISLLLADHNIRRQHGAGFHGNSVSDQPLAVSSGEHKLQPVTAPVSNKSCLHLAAPSCDEVSYSVRYANTNKCCIEHRQHSCTKHIDSSLRLNGSCSYALLSASHQSICIEVWRRAVMLTILTSTDILTAAKAVACCTASLCSSCLQRLRCSGIVLS